LIVALLTFYSGVIDHVDGSRFSLYISFGFSAFFIGLFFHKGSNKHRAALFLISSSIVVTYSFLLHGIYSSAGRGYITIVAFATLIFGRVIGIKAVLSFTIASIIVAIGYITGLTDYVSTFPDHPNALRHWVPLLITLPASGSLLVWAISFVNRNLHSALENSNRVAESLEKKNSEFQKQILWRERVSSELETAIQKAEVAGKARMEFLSVMSHELRTPLQPIMGYIDLIEDEGLSSRAQAYADVIKTSSRHLLSLIEDILEYTRIETDHLTLNQHPFYLDELVLNPIDLNGLVAEAKGISLKFDVSPCESVSDDGKVVIGDEQRLRQVLLNLISNAVKFTEEGSVTITTAVTWTSADTINFKCDVQDTGIGVPPEFLDVIFAPFYQVDSSNSRKYEGIGLGLAICKKIIEAMNGTLSVQSEEGQGSTFSLEVPLRVLDAEYVETVMQDSPAQKSEFQGKVLLVEDHPVNAQVMERVLSGFGFSLTWVKNGYEAVELFAHRSNFAVIVMDLHMPIMNGIDATKRIREMDHGKTIPILGLTARVNPESDAECLKAGMHLVIHKPASIFEVQEAMSVALGKKVGGFESPRTSHHGGCQGHGMAKFRSAACSPIAVCAEVTGKQR
jgi:signal transduction histidine kinase/CheY-like chemotaxis protein